MNNFLQMLNTAPPPGWEEGLLFQFWQNFIYQDRYMMLVNGLWLTLQITIGAVILGLAIGFITALAKLSNNKLLRGTAITYVTIIRGIPIIVQIMIWWFGIFPLINPGTPRIWVAIVAFGVNSGAYVTEIFRAGILSIDKGQTEAGRSVGLSSFQTMFLIILPQAIKNSLPALFNELITLFKLTSLAGWIGLRELTQAGAIIRSRTLEPFMPLLAVALVYLIIVIILTQLMTRLERRLRKGDSR